MIAQVRPLRPEFAAESLRHLWGVVLPAAPPAPAVAGRERRRHHTGDPITRPVERATRLILELGRRHLPDVVEAEALAS